MIGAELKGLWGDAIKWASYTKNRIPHENLTGMTPEQIFLLKEVPTRSNLRPFGQRVMIHIYKDQRKGGRWAPRAQEARIIGYTETHGVYQVITPTGKRLIFKDPRPIRENGNPKTPETPKTGKNAQENPNPEQLQEPRRSIRKGRDTRPFNQREREGLYGSPQVSKLRVIVNRVGHDDDHPTEQQVAEANQMLAKEWAEAREKEHIKLNKYGVYSIVPEVPKGHKTVDTKWVYDVKRDKEGNLLRRRARKVGRGFTQEYGKTYEETYSQMARSETWRILLSLTIQYNWHVRQWDVVAAYLNAPLTHEVYVQDTNELGQKEYWRLHKALYGLKQAGHKWYNTLRNIMNKAGLQQSIGDPRVFFKKEHKGPSIIIATHVDDMAAFAPNEATITIIESAIEEHVELEKLGQPAKLLGMELTWESKCVKLTQKTAIGNLVREFEITTTIPTKSLPLNINDYAASKEKPTLELQKKYQSLVGSLLYIARHTRSEISIHVNLLRRRTSQPSQLNFQTEIRVLKYLGSSIEQGITLRKGNLEQRNQEKKEVIKAFADASYGGEQAVSQSGSLLTMNGQVIMWSSRRQNTTAQSITKAEYIAISEVAKDVQWLRQFIEELSINSSPTIYTDNEAALKLTKTQTFHQRSRHVDHKYHYIRELVNRKLLEVKGIPAKENPADIMTKIVPMCLVKEWRSKTC